MTYLLSFIGAALTARFAGGALLNLQAVYGLYGSAFNFLYELSGSLGNLRCDAREARPVGGYPAPIRHSGPGAVAPAAVE